MKRFLAIIAAVIFITLLLPLAIVMIMGGTVDNSKPFDAPETAQQVKVYIKQNDSVQSMDVSTYLTGVTAAEMPSDFEIEALKAQAVAARTYLVSHINAQVSDEHKGAQICTDSTHCQAWVSEDNFKSVRENANEKWNKIRNAVSSTEHEIITYKKQPISAVFFSASSGYTEDAKDVWGKDTPYLRRVKSEGDELSPRYKSEETFTSDEFINKAAEKIEGIDRSKKLYGNIKRSKSGGIITLEICGTEIKGTEFRSIYGLRSTNAELSEENGTVKIEVTGFGHDVGMSQYGANYLAAKGRDYKDILKHYYSGVKIEKR